MGGFLFSLDDILFTLKQQQQKDKETFLSTVSVPDIMMMMTKQNEENR